MKNNVFWDVAPCRSCVNRRFGATYCLHLQGRKICEWKFFYPEDGCDTFLRNVGSRKIYKAPHPRRRRSCVNRRFGGTYCLHLQGRKIREREFFCPESGCDTFLRNVSSRKIYTTPHPRRRHSSYVTLCCGVVTTREILEKPTRIIITEFIEFS
jgi:hypothetical protein